MDIKLIGVIGAGQMGGGIAQVASAGGFSVVLNDIKQEFVDKGLSVIKKNLERSVSKSKITEADKASILSRIKGSVDFKDFSEADFIVEAAIEKEELKFDIFKRLDSICKPEAILSSNTSSIPIGSIASKTKRPAQVIGMHFMNPVPVMKLVEIIRGIATNDETFEITRDLAVKMGKTPAIAEDYPGFIANRILLPMINEAVYCLYSGVGTREDIDTVMKLGMNHPMGPLTLADLIGLDTCLSIMKTLHKGLGDSKYRPCPLLRRYVEAGWLGRKTKKGFYEYND